MSNGKYRKQLFKVFLIIFCILNIMGIVVSAYLVTKTQENSRIEAIAQKIDNEYIQQELKMQVVMSQILNLLSSESFGMFNHSDVDNLNYNTLKLREYLQSSIILINDFEYSIGVVHKKSDSLLVSSEGSFILDDYLEYKNYQKSEITDINNKIFNEINGLDQQYIIIPSTESNPRITYLITPQFALDNVVIILMIHETAIVPEGSSSILWNDELGVIYDGTNLKADELEAVDDNRIIKKESDKSQYQFQREIKGYDVFIRKSRVMDWYSVYLVEETNIFTPILVSILVLLYIICITASILVAKLITDRLYKPVARSIEAIADAQDSKENNGSKGYDEFKYIEDQTMILKRSNQALEKIVTNNEGLLREKYLKDKLLGIKVEPKNQFDEAFNEASSWTVAIISMNVAKNMDEEEAVVDCKRTVKTMIQKSSDIYFVNIDAYTYGLVYENADEHLEKNIRQIIVESEDFSALMIRAFVGKKVFSFKDISLSYNSAMDLMDYRYQFSDILIITEQNIQIDDKERIRYSVATENGFIEKVLAGDERARTMLKDILDMNLMNVNIDIAQKQMFVSMLNGTMNRIIGELSYEHKDEMFNNNLNYKIIHVAKDYNILSEAFHNTVSDIIDIVHIEKEKKSENMIKDMVGFIHDNYSDDIMLEDLATHLNISAKYGSLLFKRLTGANFKEYLNSYRIEMAKKVIEENKDIKVVEVANLVGFNSANSFIRVFKKYEGISPGKYMQK